MTHPTVLKSNVLKAARMIGVTSGELLRALGGRYRIAEDKKSFHPIQWDGTQRGANKVLRHMPDLTVATCGGAPGHPVQLFLQTKRGRQTGEAKKGDWIGINYAGGAIVVRAPR